MWEYVEFYYLYFICKFDYTGGVLGSLFFIMQLVVIWCGVHFVRSCNTLTSEGKLKSLVKGVFFFDGAVKSDN